MEGDHRLSHVVTSGVRIEAAVDLAALRQQRRQPSWVGPSTGSGEAVVLGMQSKATDGVDGGLTENDLSVGRTSRREAEPAKVFARARGQAAPGTEGSSAEFGPNRGVWLCPVGGAGGGWQQQKNGIAVMISVEHAWKGSILPLRLSQPVCRANW
jgi:hypothetical protein